MKLSLTKQFFAIYGLLLAIMLAIIVGWYWLSVDQEFGAIKQKERLLLHVHQKDVLSEYRSVLSDLINLSSLPIHLDTSFAKSGLKQQQAELAQTYLSYAKTRGRYDQIRYLNNHGQEVVRVNYYDGNPKVVPDAQLQDKANRYYVKAMEKLLPHQIYVSRLDLNIEHGKIEQPVKPMIRIGLGMYGKNGEESGMIVLNYLGDWLFESMKHSHHAYEQLSFLYLADQEGYWLKGPSKDKEFGFMYPDKKQVSLTYEIPKLWAAIQQKPEGQVLTDKGLYSYMAFNPLKPNFSFSAGRYNFSDRQFVTDNHAKYEWVLISFFPKNNFSVITNNQVKRGLPYVLITMVLMAFVAFVLAGYRTDQNVLRNKIKYMAYHDELTGLLNRHSLTSQDGKAFFKQSEDQQPAAVFFLDLDGFKPINDKYGHHIGDEVLKIVAKRISASVRMSDVVIRIGGDEFAVVACEAMTQKGAEHLAQKLIDKISEPMHVESYQIQLGTSIGIACYTEQCSDINRLIDAADHAMYQAKKLGKGQYFFAT